MFNLLFGKTKSDRITPIEAKERLADGKGVVLLDVRTPQEYEGAHIAGSILLPVDKIGEKITKRVADKDTEIIVYCHSGRRSTIAANDLAKLGYTNVYNLGGINSWPYETEKGFQP